MPNKRSSYFAYGSNMDAVQMKKRCKGALLEATGILEGFRFVINSRGVASIVADDKASVQGLVWSLTDADLTNLDKYEGVQEGYYSRTKAKVLTGKDLVTAWIYVAADISRGRPRPGYLERIVTAARAAGLSDEYVHQLESSASLDP